MLGVQIHEPDILRLLFLGDALFVCFFLSFDSISDILIFFVLDVSRLHIL